MLYTAQIRISSANIGSKSW